MSYTHWCVWYKTKYIYATQRGTSYIFAKFLVPSNPVSVKIFPVWNFVLGIFAQKDRLNTSTSVFIHIINRNNNKYNINKL